MKKIFTEAQELNRGSEANGQTMLREGYNKFCKFFDEYYEASTTLKDKKLAIMLKQDFLTSFDKAYALNKAIDRPTACSSEMVLKASKIFGLNPIDFEEEKRKRDYKTFVGSDKLDAYASLVKKDDRQCQNPMATILEIF